MFHTLIRIAILAKVMEHCGSSVATARFCDISPSCVHRVLHNDRIEAITGKKILAAWRRLKPARVSISQAHPPGA